MPGHAQKHKPTETLANMQPPVLRPYYLDTRRAGTLRAPSRSGTIKTILKNVLFVQQERRYDFTLHNICSDKN